MAEDAEARRFPVDCAKSAADMTTLNDIEVKRRKGCCYCIEIF
jgi:hypothetical protein